MVTLDSVGIPSGVHVKKPPMTFPKGNRKAAGFSA